MIGFDPAAAMVVPVWAVGAGAAVVLAVGVLGLWRSGSRGPILAALAALVLGAGVLWAVVDRAFGPERAAERRALVARADALAGRALAAGSPLACLDGAASDSLALACARRLFGGPETVAAAVAHVGAELALLDEAHAAAPQDGALRRALAPLRASLSADRFGVVAFVLADRRGCTAERCAALALLDDPGRVTENLRERTFETLLARHGAGWLAGDHPVPAGAGGPAMSAVPGAAPSDEVAATASGGAGATPPGGPGGPS
ncbi:hypothetical protein, partial [Rhodovulum sp. PH10]|uniref:hypothetical protein n=1 Tax=Rhodovulum sp. PH10 TaxID=1187851 RepID=UPI00068F308E